MRTTLTLDPDVARLVDEAVRREHRPLKNVVNDALRRGLGPQAAPTASKTFRVKPHRARLRPGLDPLGFNRLADELEDGAVLAKARRASR
jgi:hypothetical protein